MPLRLWQRLFLALALLAGAALACFVAWQQLSFRRSFRTYLDQVALAHLQAGAERLAERYASEGDWEFLRRDPRRLREFIEPAPWRRGERAPPEADRAAHLVDPPAPDPDDPRPPPPRPGDAARPPPRPGDAPPPPPPNDDRPPPNERGPRLPPELDALRRIVLLDDRGERVAGNPRVTAGNEVPVQVDGKRVGTLRLAPLPALLDDIDRDFAADQWHNALWVSLFVLLIALAFAFALARGLLAPVHALTAGTRALAAGDYAQRVPVVRGDELGALAQDFNRLAATLQDNREARRRWGADIAHELRTPLTILRGEIDALRDGVRAPTPQALASLQAECQRLSTLVEDLYQLSLADAGALEYRFETIDLAELVRETAEAQRHAFADIGLELGVDAPAAMAVRGDARRLGQLLDNLLGNARRYTDAPGRVQLRVARRDDSVILSVDDSAPGVPPVHLPHLFERLYRVDASRHRATGGAGLGLAICRAIVTAHGGTIDAQPSALGGLCVRVRLPLLQEAGA